MYIFACECISIQEVSNSICIKKYRNEIEHNRICIYLHANGYIFKRCQFLCVSHRIKTGLNICVDVYVCMRMYKYSRDANPLMYHKALD